MMNNKFIRYFLLPVLVIAAALLVGKAIKEDDVTVILVFVLVVCAIVFTLFYRRPPGYTLDDDGIHINGPAPLYILFGEIESVRRITPAELGGGIRWFGMGMPWYRAGRFTYFNIGPVVVNCTDATKMVLIKTEEQQAVISPDDPDEFIAMLRSKN